MKNLLSLTAIFSLLLVASCSKKLDTTSTPTNTNVAGPAAANKIAPDGFTYATSKNIQITINTLTNNNTPMPNVPMNVYTLGTDGKLGNLVWKGTTDASGAFNASISVPGYTDTLVLDAAYIGLMRYAKVAANSNNIQVTIGGAEGRSQNIASSLMANNEDLMIIQKTISYQNERRNSTVRANDINGVKTSTKFNNLGVYNSQGRPGYLEAKGDIISAEMLASINASLPERTNVAAKSPEYVASSTNTNIVVLQESDVWLTFVYEGAGYMNTLGYYSYPTGSSPKTLADITEINYVFPNCSMPGSGGDLRTGDKVKIGRFKAGTTIGLVVFANGWNGREINTSYTTAYFSDAQLNPETDAKLKKHNVLLQYKDTYIIGFEDMNRQQAGCDHDFNDVLVYASSNPVEAISNENVQVVKTPIDSDGDGTTDTFDEFPSDPTRAYTNYFPAKGVFGTLAFEDLWPYKGDYDLNDLVVKYNYMIVSNSKNNAVDMVASFEPVASGASFRNGFGIDLGIPAEMVNAVTGYKHSQSYINMNGNGIEAAQKNAVIIPFDDAQKLLRDGSGNYTMNTFMEQPLFKAEMIEMKISFNSGVNTNANNFNSLVLSNLNPFLISNMKRGAEVHLPGFKPTNLADLTLLNQGNDATNPAAGIFYVTKENYPWALNFTEPFQYPTEGSAINNAYTHFFEWAGSGGLQFKDWYSNKAADYRNTKLIYTK